MKNTNEQGLRTDLPLMEGKEVNDWIDMIIRNAYYLDLMNLYEHLTKKLEHKKMQTLFNMIFKMCNKCEITYPTIILLNSILLRTGGSQLKGAFK
jgi:hypothetical protein